MFEQQLRFAAAAISSGNLAAGEVVCRDIVDRDPRNAAALNFLGVIAVQVGVTDQAATYFKIAARADPNNDQVKNNLKKLRKHTRIERAKAPGQRYLLAKSWGFGFWSDVSQVLGNLLLAEITNRIPVIHWGTNSLFGDGLSGRDAFKLHFEPVSTVSLVDLAGLQGATYFPQKWNATNLAADDVNKWHGTDSRAAGLYFLARQESVAVSDFYVGVVDLMPWLPTIHPLHGKPIRQVYRYLIEKYLRPVESVRRACDAFFSDHLNQGPFVAVHMRGSDKAQEDNQLHEKNRSYFALIDEIDPTWRIFLLTDDEQLRAEMTNVYGDRIITIDCQRTSTATGVHYLPSISRVKAGHEVMTDTYLALRANRFIGNGSSSVSAMIDVLKDWQAEEASLIGQSILLQRNLYIHVRE